MVELQANITDYQKALVEFMRDGPQSVQQAGHWLNFAQEVSKRDDHTLDQDVKMFFYNQVVAMDAFIASWDSKMYYDFARPFALVHEYYSGEKIKAWGGVGKGMVEMDGSQWRPYSPDTFLCPPFTETAEMAGISRVLGGYHIQSENIAGLELGRDVAREAWTFYKKHIGEE